MQDIFLISFARILSIYFLTTESTFLQLRAIYSTLTYAILRLIQDGEFRPIRPDEINNDFKLVQIVSASCRASHKMHSEGLPAAALLRSLGDAEWSLCRQHRHTYHSWSSRTWIILMIGVIVTAGFVGEELVDIIISSLGTAWMLISYFLYKASPYALIAAYVLFGLAVFLSLSPVRTRLTRFAKKRLSERRSIRTWHGVSGVLHVIFTAAFPFHTLQHHREEKRNEKKIWMDFNNNAKINLPVPGDDSHRDAFMESQRSRPSIVAAMASGLEDPGFDHGVTANKIPPEIDAIRSRSGFIDGQEYTGYQDFVRGMMQGGGGAAGNNRCKYDRDEIADDHPVIVASKSPAHSHIRLDITTDINYALILAFEHLLTERRRNTAATVKDARGMSTDKLVSLRADDDSVFFERELQELLPWLHDRFFLDGLRFTDLELDVLSTNLAQVASGQARLQGADNGSIHFSTFSTMLRQSCEMLLANRSRASAVQYDSTSPDAYLSHSMAQLMNKHPYEPAARDAPYALSYFDDGSESFSDAAMGATHSRPYYDQEPASELVASTNEGSTLISYGQHTRSQRAHSAPSSRFSGFNDSQNPSEKSHDPL
jgi:hypothetical protein